MPIAEAFALTLGETALNSALRAATGYLEQARAATEHHVGVCLQYLGAASIAVRGLEQEFQSILVEADNCDLDSPADRQALRKRIGMFLFVDRLRPVLWEAVSGIEGSRASLIADADRFFRLNPKRDQQVNAVGSLNQMVEFLNEYLASMDYLPAGSGPPGTQFLLGLHGLIPRPHETIHDEGTRQAIARTVAEALGQGRTALREYTERITRTIRALDRAFE